MNEQELWEVSQRAYRAYTDALEDLGRVALVAVEMDYFDYLKDCSKRVKTLEFIWKEASAEWKRASKTPEGV